MSRLAPLGSLSPSLLSPLETPSADLSPPGQIERSLWAPLGNVSTTLSPSLLSLEARLEPLSANRLIGPSVGGRILIPSRLASLSQSLEWAPYLPDGRDSGASIARHRGEYRRTRSTISPSPRNSQNSRRHPG
jgi:hypothetical protein